MKSGSIWLGCMVIAFLSACSSNHPPSSAPVADAARTSQSGDARGGDVADRFSNPTFGLGFTKRHDWHFMTAEQNQENLARMPFKDADLKAQVARYATQPMVVVARHPEPFDDLNPSLKINARSAGQLEDLPGPEILRVLSPSFSSMFDDFTVVQPPTDSEVGGRKAGYMSMNYSLKLPDGRAFPTTSELWIVPRGSYFLMIGAGTRQDEKTGSRADIREMVESITLDEP